MVNNDKYVLGEGKYAVVLNSRKTTKVCKKITYGQSGEGMSKSFVVETSILRLLANTNHIVHCSGVSIKNDEYCLYLERYERELRYLRCVSEAQAKIIIFKLLIALNDSHEKGIIHSDISPTNILVNGSVDVAICDWGISKIALCENTLFSNCVQARWWRAPEILLGEDRYTNKIDIWSCGIIMLQLVTHIEYLKGRSADEQLHLIFKTFGTPDETTWPNVSKLRKWPKFLSSDDTTKHVPISFNILVPPGTSSGYITLMLKMLTLCPKDRISAREALMDPYFSEFPKPELVPDMNDYLQSRQIDCSYPEYVSKICVETLVQLILTTGMKFGLSFDTYFLSVSLLGIFLQKIKTLPEKDFYLYGIVSLMLSYDIHDKFSVSSHELSQACLHLYSAARIVRAEINVFKTLDFDIIRPTEYTFLQMLCLAFDDYTIKMNAAILLVVGTSSYDLRKYESFDLALSALFIVLSIYSESCDLFLEKIKTQYAEKLKNEKIYSIMEQLIVVFNKSCDKNDNPVLYKIQNSANAISGNLDRFVHILNDGISSVRTQLATIK